MKEVIVLLITKSYWAKGSSVSECRRKIKEMSGRLPSLYKSLLYVFPLGSDPYVMDTGTVCWKGKMDDEILLDLRLDRKKKGSTARA